MLRSLALTVLLALLLAGCYSSDRPVLAEGEYARLRGSFECPKLPGKRRTLSFAEHKEGWLFPAYSYREASGETYLLKKLEGSIYLAQISTGDGKVFYAYVDFRDDGGLFLLVADMLTKNAYLEELAGKHGVKVSASERGLFHVTGTDDNIRAFLLAHDKSLLTVISRCVRTGG